MNRGRIHPRWGREEAERAKNRGRAEEVFQIIHLSGIKCPKGVSAESSPEGEGS
jgi:hypothetical protein